VCFTVTLLDGIGYARSAFSHSMNHRCAVVQGWLRPVPEPAGREHGLRVLTEHLAPGSWDATRRPDRRELAATAVLALDLTEASVKARTGPPGDDDRDLPTPVWGGVLPVHTVFGEPVPDPLLPPGTAAPARVRDRRISPPA